MEVVNELVQKISLEHKQLIAARIFYADCREDYENFEEVLSDMSDGTVSEEFLNAVIEPFINHGKGLRLMVNNLGHLVGIDQKTNYVKFITLFTELEACTLQKETQDFAHANAHCSHNAVLVFQSCGWKLL